MSVKPTILALHTLTVRRLVRKQEMVLVIIKEGSSEKYSVYFKVLNI